MRGRKGRKRMNTLENQCQSQIQPTPEPLSTPVQNSVPDPVPEPVPEPVHTPDTPVPEPDLPVPLPALVPTAAPAPEPPIQEMPLRRSAMERNPTARLEVGNGKKTYSNVVKKVWVVKAGEGGRSSNLNLVLHKFKLNPTERHARTPGVTCQCDLPL